MLCSELTPTDFRQPFIRDMPLLHLRHAGWSETKKAFVVDDLLREYQVDKVGARKALFGHEAPVEEAQTAGTWMSRSGSPAPGARQGGNGWQRWPGSW